MKHASSLQNVCTVHLTFFIISYLKQSQGAGLASMELFGRAHVPLEPRFIKLHIRKFFKNQELGAGEMAQRLRALTALPEVLSSIPSNHMVAHSHL